MKEVVTSVFNFGNLSTGLLCLSIVYYIFKLPYREIIVLFGVLLFLVYFSYELFWAKHS